MRMSEIAELLQRNVPRKTNLFHDLIPISSVIASGGSASIGTDKPHGLSTGNIVSIVGCETRTIINSADVSLPPFVTFGTATDHDLTFEGGQSVKLFNFTDGDWNNVDIELTAVPNRRSFQVKSLNANPTLNGVEFLLEPNRADGINGLYEITVTGEKTFQISGGFNDGVYSPINGAVAVSPRIAVAVSEERAIELYQVNPEVTWLFVVNDGAAASKARSSLNDAVFSPTKGSDLRLKIINNFSVYLFIPTPEQLTAEEAVDIAVHDIAPILISSLFGYRPETGFSCPTSQFGVTMTDFALFDYNRAVVVYRYRFEAPVDITAEDGATLGIERAFRKVNYEDYSVEDASDDQNPTASIDLDEDPLT